MKLTIEIDCSSPAFSRVEDLEEPASKIDLMLAEVSCVLDAINDALGDMQINQKLGDAELHDSDGHAVGMLKFTKS
jgi:hypothetical protein